MKIVYIAIGLMVLIASSVAALAAGEPGNLVVIGPNERIEVESNSVVFLKFEIGDNWTIYLENKTLGAEYYNETFTGTIDAMNGKMYSVKFVPLEDGTENPGNIEYVPDYGTYIADITVTRVVNGEIETIKEVLNVEIIVLEEIVV